MASRPEEKPPLLRPEGLVVGSGDEGVRRRLLRRKADVEPDAQALLVPGSGLR